MANQTSFDLNHAIQTWRDNLANSLAFRRENLNELESHLRDSIAALQTRGLSAEESFLIATRRLDQDQQLESEFTKINHHTIWLDRAMWILIGLQVWAFVDRLMSGIAGNVFALGWRVVPHSQSGLAWPVYVSALIQLPAFAAAIWLTWTMLKKTGKLGEWIATKLSRRSSFVLCCIAACVVSFLLYVLPVVLVVGQMKFSGVPTVALIARSRNFIAPLRAIGFAILTLFLARKLLVHSQNLADQTSSDLNHPIQTWRHNLANSPAFRRENLNELESHLRDSIAALQTLGLSAEEAFLIATRRIGRDQQLAAEFTKINRHTIWLERALWMLIGLQVWPFFETLMSGIASFLFAVGSRSLPHYPAGHARAIFLSAFLQLPALIAAIWLTWTVLRKSGKFGEWIATKLPERSSFAFCCIAATVLVLMVYALEAFLRVGWHKFSGDPYFQQTFSYIDDSRLFIMPLRAIGFIILTLLLARKRLIPQKA